MDSAVIDRARKISNLHRDITMHIEAMSLWVGRDAIPPRAGRTIKASLASPNSTYDPVDIPNPVFSILRQAMINHHEAEIERLKLEIAATFEG